MFDFSIDMQHENRVVKITLMGDVEKISLLNVINKQRSLVQAKTYSRLYDFQNCTFSISDTDLYYLPRFDDKAESKLDKAVKIALLIDPQSDNDDVAFFETTALNVGRNVKVFSAETEAYKWLDDQKNTIIDTVTLRG